MKKLLLYIMSSVVALSSVSCKMDRVSPDSIPYDKAFESIGNLESLERGLYSRLRTAYSMESMMAPDIQADYVHPIFGFSNTFGKLYNWTYTQDEQELSVAWQNFYGVIGMANFIIDGINNKLTFEVLPGSVEAATISRVQGVSYLIRALSYSVLAERFCADYDDKTADAQYSGLPLALEYNPDVIPNRATLRKTYESIFEDLKSAKSLLKNIKGQPNSTVLNTDCISFLEARVLLQTDQHAQAYKVASDFLKNNKAYSLVASAEDLKKAWTYDKSTETVFQFYASKTETAYQFGYYFCADNFNGMEQSRLMIPDFIPTKDCLDMYDEKDWRKSAYFHKCSSERPSEDGIFYMPFIKGHSAYADNLYIITKYPGNPDLRTTAAWNYVNTYKVFRLAELYLIAAEAAVLSENDAQTPLNQLREKRGLQPLESVSLEDVKAERYREMMFEGTRMTDLKRWGDNLKRGKVQEGFATFDNGSTWESVSFVTVLNSQIEINKGDYRFVWPVPSSEIFANPAFAEQQNPGWKR